METDMRIEYKVPYYSVAAGGYLLRIATCANLIATDIDGDEVLSVTPVRVCIEYYNGTRSGFHGCDIHDGGIAILWEIHSSLDKETRELYARTWLKMIRRGIPGPDGLIYGPLGKEKRLYQWACNARQ